jgi:hypothetical protein
MASFARRITIAALIAGLISAAPVPAMAQWVTLPSDDAMPQSSPFANSTDFRPEWPDFAPLPPSEPNPPGDAKLIEIPNPPHDNNEPNVLILPQVIAPERLPAAANWASYRYSPN